MKVAVLGAGAYGSAMGGVLAENGHEVSYYDPFIPMFSDFNAAVMGASVLVLAVPSAAVSETLERLPRELPLVVLTKGILTLEMFEGFSDLMVVSGPGFADEIKKHSLTLLTATDARAVSMFETDYLKFDSTSDMRGVLMCGALKNVYAILAGRLGLEAGTPEWEKFIREASEEMQALLSVNGAEPSTVLLSCGVGDLRLTCGEGSRNYEFGRMLRENPGAEPLKTVEGLTTLEKIRKGEIRVPEEVRMLRELMAENS